MHRAVAVALALALGVAPAAFAAQGVTVRDAATNTPAGVDASNNFEVNCRVGCSGSTPPAATPSSTPALGGSQILKASAGTLFSFEVNADATLSAAAWFVMIFNSSTVPADGAVAPVKCYGQSAGTAQMGGTLASNGVAFSNGIVIVTSTTGCFTKTISAHAFISGDFQ